jgi:hypothetical protein
LTTNWDSLLERAVDAYDRSYDVVITVKQIASVRAPRIVKLHGCIRSGTDLIFTEESFRTYPKEYAPFVSLVQQSLMENVIVLFGFSGADPNFRAWHGWVRDHLGSNLQPIYMVTLRPTEPVDVHLMAGRLITHIDLSQKWGDLEDRKKIEMFFEEIQKRLRRLHINLDWPSDHRLWTEEHPGLNFIVNDRAWQQRLSTYPGWLMAPARNRADLVSHLEQALAIVFDPSFKDSSGLAAIVAKHTPRTSKGNGPKLLNDREQAALGVCKSLRIAMARPGQRLSDKLKEILGQALVDIFEVNIKPDKIPNSGTAPQAPRVFESIDDKMLDFIGIAAANAGEAVRAKAIIETASNDASLGRYRASVRDVVFELLPLIETVEREARLRADDITARCLRDVLWLAGGDDPLREAAVSGALMSALAKLDLGEIEALVGLRPNQPHDAAGNLRHAGVLREIGKIREAYVEISTMVARLRSLGSERRRGIAESSKEAWAFYLYADLLERNMSDLEAFTAVRPGSLQLIDVYEELHERLDELETMRCDPRREMDRLARDLEVATEQARLLRLMRPSPTGLPSSSEADPADPGREYVLADPANTFVLLSEIIGVAIHHIRSGYPLALIASRLLAATDRRLAIDLLLRAGSADEIPFEGAGPPGLRRRPRRAAADIRRIDQGTWSVAEVVFDKSQTHADFEMLTALLNRLAAPSSEVSQDFIRPSYLNRKVRLLQHLLAGLIEREDGTLAKALAAEGFEVGCRLAYSPVIAATRAGWSNSLRLFEAVLSRFPLSQITPKELLTKLLDLPIPTEADDSTAECWPDPIRLLVDGAGSASNRPVEMQAPKAELRNLGLKITKAVKQELGHDQTLKSVLQDHDRRWTAMIAVSGPNRRLIVERRLELIRSVMSEPFPEQSTASDKENLGTRVRRARKVR